MPVLFLVAFFALIPGYAAQRKGRSFWGYYALSFLLTPLFSLVIVSCMGEQAPHSFFPSDFHDPKGIFSKQGVAKRLPLCRIESTEESPDSFTMVGGITRYQTQRYAELTEKQLREYPAWKLKYLQEAFVKAEHPTGLDKANRQACLLALRRMERDAED